MRLTCLRMHQAVLVVRPGGAIAGFNSHGPTSGRQKHDEEDVLSGAGSGLARR